MPTMDTGQLSLDQDSSLLMTFNSPFRRYHFLWLPFGLVCSQDIFPKKMDQILKECQGCIGITDDITKHGYTKVEHDACLRDLMHIACKYDLVFNPQKTHVKPQAINFFGCLYDANGVHPRPRQGWCCTCLASTHQCHWTSRVLRSSHIP